MERERKGGPAVRIVKIGEPRVNADIRELCERLAAVPEGERELVCDVGGLTDADAATVECLARLQLSARRLDHRVWLRHAPVELRELLGFLGLDEIVPCLPESAFETSREAEEREPPGGVEEEGDPTDPIA